MAALTACWLGYVTSIGGGFMEYRLLDVLLPPAYVAIGAAALRLWADAGRAARGAIVAAAVALALSNLVADRGFERREHLVLTRYQMSELTTMRWAHLGRWLGRIAEEGESVATTAAGAIPYFSRLPAVDMLGLNDAVVARQPDLPGRRVGHRKLAGPAYLAERGVTFVLGEPYLSPAPDFAVPGPGRADPARRQRRSSRARRTRLLRARRHDPRPARPGALAAPAWGRGATRMTAEARR